MRKAARYIFALATFSMLLWQASAAVSIMQRNEPVTTVRSIDHNEAVQASIDLLVDQSTAWSQLALLLLAALAALWIAKPEEVRLTTSMDYLPEIVMWVGGVTLLLGSLYAHTEYVDSIAKALKAGGVTAADTLRIPDVFAEVFDSIRELQLQTLLLGALSSAAAPFSVWNMMRKPDEK
jgi:hypothetical protein